MNYWHFLWLWMGIKGLLLLLLFKIILEALASSLTEEKQKIQLLKIINKTYWYSQKYECVNKIFKKSRDNVLITQQTTKNKMKALKDNIHNETGKKIK